MNPGVVFIDCGEVPASRAGDQRLPVRTSVRLLLAGPSDEMAQILAAFRRPRAKAAA